MIETTNTNNTLKEVQTVLISMMETIHTICKENNIPYFLSDGSLLGSIRHRGFIPWDDDIDIGMLRKDYNRFKKVLKTSLPDIYKVESYNLNTHGKHNWLKVMYLENFHWVDSDGNRYKGISIDIFPFDFVPEKGQLSLPGQIFNRLSRIYYPKKINGPKPFIHFILNRLKLYNLYSPFNKETKTITYGLETPFYGWRFFDLDEIFPLKTGTFEGREFTIPKNPDYYLKTVYGDYMKVPDEADRHFHYHNLQS
jgi:lipopolysaccharide cholinephosphotransferase